MAVTGVIGANNTPEVVAPNKTGFNSLTSEDFLRMLVTQLQNQDPSEPVGNDELLNQLSMMRALQSNLELGEAMQAVTTNQTLATAASFIGKSIKGLDAEGNPVSGRVETAFMSEGKAFVRVGGVTLPLTNVSEVSAAN